MDEICFKHELSIFFGSGNDNENKYDKKMTESAMGMRSILLILHLKEGKL